MKIVVQSSVDKVKLMILNDGQDAASLVESEYRTNFVIDIISKFKCCKDAIKYSQLTQTCSREADQSPTETDPGIPLRKT